MQRNTALLDLSFCSSIHENLSAFWNLYQKYQKGDRIVKRKGEKALLLIHQADSTCVHLSYKQDDL